MKTCEEYVVKRVEDLEKKVSGLQDSLIAKDKFIIEMTKKIDFLKRFSVRESSHDSNYKSFYFDNSFITSFEKDSADYKLLKEVLGYEETN